MGPSPATAQGRAAQPFRLPGGGLIDRERPLRFDFDGVRHDGYAGDTLASALLAAGTRLVGRSFKYHRPRGILAAGAEEPNALVELGIGARREPNSRATTTELRDGISARSQNRFPSLRHDLAAVNQYLAPFLGAGFYYKTFMWPASFWEPVYERLIRRAAGLGRAAALPDPDRYEKRTAFCDVLVVGGGPAGLMAALVGARAGARVILAEEDFRFGGRALIERRDIGGRPAAAWVDDVVAELAAMPEVRLLPRTSVAGAYDGGTYGALERVTDHLDAPDPTLPRQRLWRIVATRCVLAAGAIERPLVFANNDRPGVMLAGAVSAYLNRYAVAPGSRAVLFANNDAAAATALDLARAAIPLAAIVDPRPEASATMRNAAERAGAALLSGAVLRDVLGRRAVEAAMVALPDGRTMSLDCDLIAVSGGWSPTLHLATHQGAKPVWDDRIAAFVPPRDQAALPPGMAVAGAASGALSLAEAVAEGMREGARAAAACGLPAALPNGPEIAAESTFVHPVWRIPGGRRPAFIDLQNDVTDKDVQLAEREGFRGVEHLKRYTTLGMATDQGKTSNVAGLATMADITGTAIAHLGTTTFRPPYTPVALGALAGHQRGQDFRPIRRTPAHDWARAQGAAFIEAGPWLRASHFRRPGEDWLAACTREARAVRSTVGLCDVGTLGKIEVVGRDAAALLDRVYANTVSTLPVGRVRYGLMLREDGFVLDDGTAARLAADRFVITTTTAHAAEVLAHLELARQFLFPSLAARLTPVTDQWAQFAIAGPASRAVIAAVADPPFDVGDAAFPFMAAGELTVCGGTPARLFRISFSGERAYELAVPARHGDAMAGALMQAGAPHGIVAYGLEALNVLRVEKGYITGAEANGQTTAHDLGLARMLSTQKDFIGRAMAARRALRDPARPSLVGLRPVARGRRPHAGAHLLPQGRAATAANDQGHVTSVAFSPALGEWIGLGLLSHGQTRMGEILRAWDKVRAGDVAVEIVAPVFVDPAGTRLRG